MTQGPSEGPISSYRLGQGAEPGPGTAQPVPFLAHNQGLHPASCPAPRHRTLQTTALRVQMNPNPRSHKTSKAASAQPAEHASWKPNLTGEQRALNPACHGAAHGSSSEVVTKAQPGPEVSRGGHEPTTSGCPLHSSRRCIPVPFQTRLLENPGAGWGPGHCLGSEVNAPQLTVSASLCQQPPIRVGLAQPSPHPGS